LRPLPRKEEQLPRTQRENTHTDSRQRDFRMKIARGETAVLSRGATCSSGSHSEQRKRLNPEEVARIAVDDCGRDGRSHPQGKQSDGNAF